MTIFIRCQVKRIASTISSLLANSMSSTCFDTKCHVSPLGQYCSQSKHTCSLDRIDYRNANGKL